MIKVVFALLLLILLASPAQNPSVAQMVMGRSCADPDPVCEIKSDGRMVSFDSLCAARRSGAVDFVIGPCVDDD